MLTGCQWCNYKTLLNLFFKRGNIDSCCIIVHSIIIYLIIMMIIDIISIIIVLYSYLTQLQVFVTHMNYRTTKPNVMWHGIP